VRSYVTGILVQITLAAPVLTAAQIEANVVRIGFRLHDVKILLNTQAHFDHAGGFAGIKRVTGAKLTPGHTKGCTTWTWDARDRGRMYHVVDVCSLTILPGTKVSGMPAYPEIARDYERTFDVLRSLPCDIFLGAHGSYYGAREKAVKMREQPDRANAFVDPVGYRTYVGLAEERFRQQLAHDRQ